ncbi:Protein angel 2 [Irineochytrium annulatum]|nr:Protein angel 2 [Irineochytrium annulatum]
MTWVNNADLAWDIRSARLMSELKYYGCDFICLQEVELSAFYRLFEPELGKLGYQGRYKKRLGDNIDGCAIFWKDKFCLKRLECVEYGIRENVGIVASFSTEEFGSAPCIVIATTHLLFNTHRGLCKLAQFQILAETMHQFMTENAEVIPGIFCGDLNVLPGSVITNYILSGQNVGGPPPHVLNKLIKQRRAELSGPNPSESAARFRARPGGEIPPILMEGGRPKDHMRHPIKFKTAVPFADVENRAYVTTEHAMASCLVDYVMYSSPEKLSVLGYLEPPTTKIVIPSIHHPSDHFPLIVHFRLQL